MIMNMVKDTGFSMYEAQLVWNFDMWILHRLKVDVAAPCGGGGVFLWVWAVGPATFGGNLAVWQWRTQDVWGAGAKNK